MGTPHFPAPLAETIAWCSVENNPPETDEFRHREQLLRQSRALFRRAELLGKKDTLHSWLLHDVHFGPRDNPEELRRQAHELSRAGDVASILPLNNRLRTPDLRPQPFCLRQTNRADAVEGLSEKRAGLLRQPGAHPKSISFDLAGGKLLAYEPDDNVEDGDLQSHS